MDGAHPHLLFNHFPIIGSIISLLVLIASYLLKNETVRKTGLVIVVFSAVMTIPVSNSGHDAERALEAIGKDPHSIIHEHEELGETGLWTTLATGALALLSLFYSKKKTGPLLTIITTIVLAANTLFLIKIGEAGGVIRHTEIREVM